MVYIGSMAAEGQSRTINPTIDEISDALFHMQQSVFDYLLLESVDNTSSLIIRGGRNDQGARQYFCILGLVSTVDDAGYAVDFCEYALVNTEIENEKEVDLVSEDSEVTLSSRFVVSYDLVLLACITYYLEGKMDPLLKWDVYNSG